MTLGEYFKSMANLEDEYKKSKAKLSREFALSNNPYKIGDMFTDHIGSIKIERIEIYFDSISIPECVYYGVESTKQGVPFKRQTNRGGYQSNDIKYLNKKEV